MIDSHQHLWHYAKEEYPWIPEGSPHAPVFHRRELTLLASRNALPSGFPAIINLIREGKINTDVWITHRISFDEVPEKFAQFTDPNLGGHQGDHRSSLNFRNQIPDHRQSQPWRLGGAIYPQ